MFQNEGKPIFPQIHFTLKVWKHCLEWYGGTESLLWDNGKFWVGQGRSQGEGQIWQKRDKLWDGVSKSFKLSNISYYCCVWTYGWHHTSHWPCVRTEDNFWEMALPFHQGRSKDWPRAITLDRKFLYSLRNLGVFHLWVCWLDNYYIIKSCKQREQEIWEVDAYKTLLLKPTGNDRAVRKNREDGLNVY